MTCYFAVMDVVDLRAFYAQRLGVVARRFVGRGIRARWKDTRAQRVLGIGYATPYLGLFREEAERCFALMPAPQGVVRWPSSRPGLAALVEEDELPLTDAAVDRVLLVHALEMSADAAELLREVWRVLAPGGRLLAVVPNRRGLWARMDTTPFGQGRPYSRTQITQLLRETWFTPNGWDEALYVPPIGRGWFLRSAVAWERTGATLSAPFAGVHIVEATKQVYRAIPARREKRRFVPALKPVLAPVPGACRPALIGSGCGSLPRLQTLKIISARLELPRRLCVSAKVGFPSYARRLRDGHVGPVPEIRC